jgi:hypothetical protein
MLGVERQAVRAGAVRSWSVRHDRVGPGVDLHEIALLRAGDEDCSPAVARAVLHLLADPDGGGHRAGPGIDDRDGARITLDHEHMAAGAVEGDGVRILAGWDLPGDLGSAAEIAADRDCLVGAADRPAMWNSPAIKVL